MSTSRNRNRSAQRDRMRQVSTGQTDGQSQTDDGRQRLVDTDRGEDPALPGMPEQPAPPTPSAPKPAAPAAVPRVRPVRTTVELAPREHASLKRFCADSAEELGLSSIAGAEVLRTLYGLMREDPALADRVRTAIAASGGTRRR